MLLRSCQAVVRQPREEAGQTLVGLAFFLFPRSNFNLVGSCRIFCQRCARTVGTQLGVPLKSDRQPLDQPWMFSKPGVSQANCVLHVHRMGKTDERNSTCGAFFPAVTISCGIQLARCLSFLRSFVRFSFMFFSFLSFPSSFLPFFLFSVSISLLPPSLSLSPPRRSLNCNSPQLQGVSGEDVECPKLL